MLININSTARLCPQSRYMQAKLSVHDRALKVAAVVESLEREMQLLCLTGVEDRLQADVRPTLEMLRNAGIKVRHLEQSTVSLQLRDLCAAFSSWPLCPLCAHTTLAPPGVRLSFQEGAFSPCAPVKQRLSYRMVGTSGWGLHCVKERSPAAFRREAVG